MKNNNKKKSVECEKWYDIKAERVLKLMRRQII